MNRLLLLVLTVAVFVVGCGTKPPPTPVEVKGKLVDAKGKGVPDMVVTLNPAGEENKAGPRLTRPTGKDGSFSGQCWPGPYKVTVSGIPTGPGHSPGGGPPGVPAEIKGRPMQPAQDTVTVPEGGTDSLTIQLR
jgi:hypothetical protein